MAAFNWEFSFSNKYVSIKARAKKKETLLLRRRNLWNRKELGHRLEIPKCLIYGLVSKLVS